jgi:hypothetical protein
MAIAKGARQPEYQLIDEGFYVFELTQVREAKAEDNPFKKGTMRITVPLEWTCRDDDDFAGETVLQYYTLSLGSAEYPSKLRPFAAALLGRAVTEQDEDEGVDLDDFVGTRIKATVKHYTKQDGSVGAKLESPLPIKRRSEKPKAEAPPPVPADDDDDDLGPFAQSA